VSSGVVFQMSRRTRTASPAFGSAAYPLRCKGPRSCEWHLAIAITCAMHVPGVQELHVCVSLRSCQNLESTFDQCDCTVPMKSELSDTSAITMQQLISASDSNKKERPKTAVQFGA
jgi:hypothetical protein